MFTDPFLQYNNYGSCVGKGAHCLHYNSLFTYSRLVYMKRTLEAAKSVCTKKRATDMADPSQKVSRRVN